jgi:hypothetical protein
LFAFHLALRLGRFVDDILDNMTAAEFADWSIFLSLKPEEVQGGNVEQDLLKVFGNPSKRTL